MVAWFYEEGYKPENQAKLRKRIQDWYSEKYNRVPPSDQTLKPKVRKLWYRLGLDHK